MGSFLGFGGSSKPEEPAKPALDPKNAKVREQIKNQVAQEMATAYATGLVNALSENCFKQCIQVPGDSLSATEDKCVTDCSAKFMRAWNLVSKEYIARINSQ